jgi:uncharacterized protein (DUF983 family)
MLTVPMRSIPQQIIHPRCPRCGEGKLFASTLKITDRCAACGLDLSKHDAGDGPTFFVILLVGFLITAGAVVVEVKFAPALWVHGLIWVPLTFISCIVFLRMFKMLLVTLEYRLEILKSEKPND